MNFSEKDARPMLIGMEQPAFNDENYLYEIKLDGVRCLAYLDAKETFLQNKRGLKLNKKFPELMKIHLQVKKRCILDGELYVFHDGTNDFFEVQRRTLTSDPFKIRMQAKRLPATFTAFDVLMIEDEDLTQQPLSIRKKRLSSLVKENDRFNVSRVIAGQGLALFELSKENGLEGIVAKHKESRYQLGKKTTDWIKSKNLMDDDFVITGYIPKENGIVSLVLAQYQGKQLVYKGHVTMGVSLPYLHAHSKKTEEMPFSDIPSGNDDAIWISPYLVGCVKFMEYTNTGGLRQPVFKGFREDKEPIACVVPENI